MRAAILACAAFAVAALPAEAASNSETAGIAVAVALPVVAGGLTLYKGDYDGTVQLAVSTALTVATAYGIKHVVRECRPFARPCAPNSSNWDSFPSDTSALAFAPAQFLWQRYGWEYGLPAYGAATFVAWSRVDSGKHHWYDTAASFGISLLYNQIFTTEYHKKFGWYSDVDADSQSVSARIGYRW